MVRFDKVGRAAAFYRVRESEAAYPVDTADGAWILEILPVPPEITSGEPPVLVVANALGIVVDARSFNPKSPAGNFTIAPDGSFGLTLMSEDSTIGLSGTLTSMDLGVIPVSVDLPGGATITRVTDRGICEGSWSGTFGGRAVSFDVSSIGQITNVTGFAAPVSGRMLCLGSGLCFGHLVTSDPGDDGWNQIVFHGPLTGDSLTGQHTRDTEGGPHGAAILSR